LPAAGEIERRLDRGETLVVAAPVLVESYAVLTRLPAPHRMSPADGLALLGANFLVEGVEIVALDADAYRRLLRGAPGGGVAGGRTYDAVVAACAMAARADVLLTFNERHFLSFATPSLLVVVPR
jgi:predicted nucleic acid-binding protein